jgi:23S rRNA (guanine2535-N1)-methyltransferase
LIYKYAGKNNYEDYASGRVIYHRSGKPGFPVRLASEIFSRCVRYLPQDKAVTIYDPCCGSGYFLTVLGFIYPERIKEIYASDIDDEALVLANENLSLLTEDGLLKRKAHIEKMLSEYNKTSHLDALKSIGKFIEIVRIRKNDLSVNCFQADVFSKDDLKNHKFVSDIVIADVPYGNMAIWSDQRQDPIDIMLDVLRSVININSIIAVSYIKA